MYITISIGQKVITTFYILTLKKLTAYTQYKLL